MACLLSGENFRKMSEFIYRRSGIFLEEEKHYGKLARYVDARAEAIGAEHFRNYFYRLRFEDKEGHEFQDLMNAITVNETYFFREKEQIEALVAHMLPELHRKRPAEAPIRILSAPCSTGEEPYSMVLQILEEAKIVETRDIEIVGIDIDSTVIGKGRTGNYSARSVHAVPEPMLGRWFRKTGSGYELVEELAGTVDFHVLNVFDRAGMRRLGQFDVIFSRNMLIYFDDASRKEVAMTFYDMLKPEGYVCLGHAEYMSRIVPVFKAHKVASTLIYQKQE
jgi:chemotaxis protein methyltransferase CheR